MLYFVIYWNNGTASISDPRLTPSDAWAAATWYQSLQGTTYTQIVSVPITVVSSWGTPPTQ